MGAAVISAPIVASVPSVVAEARAKPCEPDATGKGVESMALR
jgi:hypothetical protein